MRQLNKQRQNEQYIEWPIFGDRQPLRIKKTFEPYQSIRQDKEPTMWEKVLDSFKIDKMPDVEPFYAWECVTLVRGMFNTTFDIVVRDMNHLLCLLHVVHRFFFQDFET